MRNKKILIAPLNWGLGHATRCIPIIHHLIFEKYHPVIASDGAALNLLKKEFPNLEFHDLPSYNVEYSKNGRNLKWKLLMQAPHILKTIAEEKKYTDTLVKENFISGIISDNRWGVFSKLVPSVFITHQLKVFSGSLTPFSTKIQHYYINRFDECWVPDVEGDPNLSGIMGHGIKPQIPLRYLGIVSRFEKTVTSGDNDILVILSGPEPQREILEKMVISELKGSNFKVILVRGLVENVKQDYIEENITIYNFLNSEELEIFLNSSKLVICRSGYTSIMDLVKLQKRALLIPTPGQYEQEYLAKSLAEKGFFQSCRQEDFSLKLVEKTLTRNLLSGFELKKWNSEALAFFEGK